MTRRDIVTDGLKELTTTTATDLQVAWNDGNLKLAKHIIYQIEATLALTKKQIKEDLFDNL